MSLRASGGDVRLPDPAITLGQGTHASSPEAVAVDFAIGCSSARESGSLFPLDAQHLVPAHADCFGAHAASHDRAVLHGMVSDADHRPAADHRLVLVDLGVLYGCPARVVSEELETFARVAARSDGRWSGTHGH